MSPRTSVDQTLNHLFRQESGKMISVMVKIFGPQHIQMAEDTVQDALVTALETWKYKGMPENPRAWLYKVAKNKAIDIIRKNKHTLSLDGADPQHQLLASGFTLSNTMDNYWQEDQIKDDFLGMMYACCHPEIPTENQITFILKSLCGFSTKEVAKSFLTNQDTVSKRLYRTKEYFRQNNIRPTIPSSSDIEKRTGTVLSAIYRIFNEGYSSTHSDSLVRTDLIEQAMYLCKSLLEHKNSRFPEAYALMAYLCFHASRAESRTTQEGEFILLAQQDRRSWNKELLEQGNEFMNLSAFGDRISTYHYEAAIAYEHCVAKDFLSTNWELILSYYDALTAMSSDPVFMLNRAVVVLQLHGPAHALEVLESIKQDKRILNYYLYYSVLGEIYERLGVYDEAAINLRKAMELTLSRQEKNYLNLKLKKLNSLT